MDLDTREMLRASLRPLLSDRGDGRLLAARLAELGWDDVLAEDATTAHRILFAVRGEVLSDADALGPLLAATVAEVADMPDAARAVVVLPPTLDVSRPAGHVQGSELLVDGLALSTPPAGACLLVPAVVDDGFRLAITPCPAQVAAVSGVDPDLGLTQIAGTVDAGDVTWISGAPAVDACDAAVAAGRWALAAELCAIGARVISEAVEYTKERTQYGRPIGSFQALQHRLASAHASVVGATHVVDEAARSGSGWDALVAKYLAGRAAEFACTQAQQSYGAIGFTWEHDFHRSLRRTYSLDRILGGWRELESEIGRTLQRTGVVPKIGAL